MVNALQGYGVTVSLKACRAIRNVGLALTNHYYRVSYFFPLKLLRFRSPFLFAADVLAKFYILALQAGKLLLKAENFFLQIEHARPKRKNLFKSI